MNGMIKMFSFWFHFKIPLMHSNLHEKAGNHIIETGCHLFFFKSEIILSILEERNGGSLAVLINPLRGSRS